MAMAMANKTAHELSIDGDEPPPRYFVKQSQFGTIDPSISQVSIPIVDLNLLFSDGQQELHKFRSALTSWGCFQAIGHKIEESKLDQVRNVAKQFFQLPIDEKKKYSRTANEGEGYGGDTIVWDKQTLDWSDRIVLKVLPTDERKLHLWPQTPTNFSETLNDYGMKIKAIIDLLFKYIAKSLDLEENTFLDQFGDRAKFLARFNFYPPCPRPDQVLGLKPHSDKSGITVLLQDKEIEGLHVLKDKIWYKVPIIPHALVVNVGDQMEIMSNGMIKSPVHRAVTNPERLRISVAVSNEPQPDREIGPANGLIDDTRPRLYKTVKDYAAFNFGCFQKGEVALESIKIKT